jgi:hypothetical protein
MHTRKRRGRKRDIPSSARAVLTQHQHLSVPGIGDACVVAELDVGAVVDGGEEAGACCGGGGGEGRGGVVEVEEGEGGAGEEGEGEEGEGEGWGAGGEGGGGGEEEEGEEGEEGEVHGGVECGYRYRYSFVQVRSGKSMKRT